MSEGKGLEVTGGFIEPLLELYDLVLGLELLLLEGLFHFLDIFLKIVQI